MRKDRITELDIFRGICILGVFLSHFYYDLNSLMGLGLPVPKVLDLLFTYGGILFVVLSGVCVTLGSRSVKRGLIVLGCGLGVTAATYVFGLLTDSPYMLVRFGILHLLGVCMLLYPLLRKLPNGVTAVLGLVVIVLGYGIESLRIENRWLFPLGFLYPGFFSADFWPVLPNLGYFMLGIVLGRTIYGKKRPLFPKLQGRCRFLSFCGRHSLILYLAQQPVTMGILMLLSMIL